MLAAKTRWHLPQIDQDKVDQYVQELEISPVVARILLHRGIDKIEDAEQFLHPSLDQLHDAYLLKDMDLAVERIQRAICAGENIVIYGDYDVDGMSSTALLMSMFRGLDYDNISYYIPSRQNEGYGLNNKAIDLLKQQGAQLIITVDNGISSVNEAEYIRSLGMDLIITDHHQPGSTLPAAYAVINPNQADCNYPFKYLAGVGVAFKLATALLKRLPTELFGLAALGTIADLMPLIGENRVLAAYGLKLLSLRHDPGITALLEVAGISRDVTATDVGFTLGPRLNASGRLASARAGVELLLSSDKEEARKIAVQLDNLNQERQQLVDQIFQEAIAQIEQEPDLHQYAIVVAKEAWHIGVIGIVASRLVEQYYRPVIVIGIDIETGLATGSGRSIENFNIYKAVAECSSFLLHYGGHAMAAGMSLKQEEIGELQRNISRIARESLTPGDYVKSQLADDILTADLVNQEFIAGLDRLEPYGAGHKRPLFIIKDLQVDEVKMMGAKKQHVKLALSCQGSSLNVVGFRMPEAALDITPLSKTQILGELQINHFNGRSTPQILLRDIEIDHTQILDLRGNRSNLELPKSVTRITAQGWLELQENLLNLSLVEHLAILDPPPSIRAFEQMLAGLRNIRYLYLCYTEDAFKGILPQMPKREEFRSCYLALASIESDSFSLAHHMKSLMRVTGLAKSVLSFILKVFDELELVTIESDSVYIHKNKARRELVESQHYREHEDKSQVMKLLYYSSYKEIVRYILERLSLTETPVKEVQLV